MPTPRNRVIVVVLALLLGASLTVGTAYAAPLTKKKVKAIAVKVVKRQAPNLSVKSAKTADTAVNTTQLGGAAPDAFRTFGVSSSSTGNLALPAATVTQLTGPEGFTVPAGSIYLHITGSASFQGGDTDVAFWYQLDNTCQAAGTGFNIRQFGNTDPNQDSISITALEGVAPGDHTIRLCARSTLATTATHRTVVATTVNFAGD